MRSDGDSKSQEVGITSEGSSTDRVGHTCDVESVADKIKSLGLPVHEVEHLLEVFLEVDCVRRMNVEPLLHSLGMELPPDFPVDQYFDIVDLKGSTTKHAPGDALLKPSAWLQLVSDVRKAATELPLTCSNSSSGTGEGVHRAHRPPPLGSPISSRISDATTPSPHADTAMKVTSASRYAPRAVRSSSPRDNPDVEANPLYHTAHHSTEGTAPRRRHVFEDVMRRLFPSDDVSAPSVTDGGVERNNNGTRAWVNGNGDGSMEGILRTLFVQCGAIDQGNGLELTLDRLDLVLAQRCTERGPPAPIIDDVKSSIAAVIHSSSTPNLSQGPQQRSNCLSSTSVKLYQFSTLLMEQLRQTKEDIGAGCADGDSLSVPFFSSQRPPPTLCMLVAFLDSMTMECLCGCVAVNYLRSIRLMEAALHELVKQLSYRVEHLLARDGAASPAPVMKRESVDSGHPPRPRSSVGEAVVARDRSGRTKQSKAFVTKSPHHGDLDASAGSHRSLNLAVRTSTAGGGDIKPRYMESRPVDEITASMVARAKARRLMSELHRTAIPIHRYEAVPVLETLPSTVERTVVFTDDDASDNLSNFSNELNHIEQLLVSPKGVPAADTVHSDHRGRGKDAPVRVKIRHVVGGPSKRLVARQATFERLCRSRYDPRTLSIHNDKPAPQLHFPHRPHESHEPSPCLSAAHNLHPPTQSAGPHRRIGNAGPSNYAAGFQEGAGGRTANGVERTAYPPMAYDPRARVAMDSYVGMSVPETPQTEMPRMTSSSGGSCVRGSVRQPLGGRALCGESRGPPTPLHYPPLWPAPRVPRQQRPRRSIRRMIPHKPGSRHLETNRGCEGERLLQDDCPTRTQSSDYVGHVKYMLHTYLYDQEEEQGMPALQGGGARRRVASSFDGNPMRTPSSSFFFRGCRVRR